tara:strand:+ start:1883 stop:2338 length:456 start_codon:yes stop_codon:yes gene_type:complete
MMVEKLYSIFVNNLNSERELIALSKDNCVRILEKYLNQFTQEENKYIVSEVMPVIKDLPKIEEHIDNMRYLIKKIDHDGVLDNEIKRMYYLRIEKQIKIFPFTDLRKRYLILKDNHPEPLHRIKIRIEEYLSKESDLDDELEMALLKVGGK